MGSNTTIFILNDHLDEIKENSKGFVEKVIENIHNGGQDTWIVGQTTIMPTAHADVPRLYFTWQNTIIEIDPVWAKDRIVPNKWVRKACMLIIKRKIKEWEKFIEARQNGVVRRRNKH